MVEALEGALTPLSPLPGSPGSTWVPVPSTLPSCTWKVGPSIGLARVQFSFSHLMLCCELGRSRPHQPFNYRINMGQSANIHPSGPDACGLPRRLLLGVLHPGHSPPFPLPIRRSIIPGQIASETRWAQIRSSVRATFRGLRLEAQTSRAASRMEVLPAPLFSSFFPPFFPPIFHLPPWLVDGRLTSLPPRSIVVCGSCKTRERAPGVPADRWLRGETMLLDPRWPHGSSAGVAQRQHRLGEKLREAGGAR